MSKFSRLESSDSNLITGDKTYLSAIKVLGKKYFDNNDIYSCAKEIKLTSDTLSEYKVAKPFALDAKGTKFLKNVEKLKDEYEKFLKDVEKACNEYESSLTGSKEEFVNGALETVNMLLPGVVPATVLNPASSVNPLETVDLLMPGVVPDQLLIVNQKMNGNSKGATNGGTQKAATNTTTKESSTGATTTKSGTSSELQKKLKVQEEEADKEFIEKRKAEAAAEEAQDKANRAAAEKQEEEKRRHMAEAEAENVKEEAAKLKTENEELRKKLEKNDTPSEVTPTPAPQPEPHPEPTPKPSSEPTPTVEPKPESTPASQPTSKQQTQTYTQPSIGQQSSSTNSVVDIKPNEQVKIEPITPTEKTTTQSTTKSTATPLPNPNAGDTNTESGSSSKSSGSSVVPIAVGLGAAVAGGIGIKALHDHKKNSKFDDQNEDSVTNGNRFWTDEDPNVMHTEEDLFNENIDTNDVSYQAVENNSVTPDLDTNINNDTWSIEEDEIKDNNTFDLLSENN